MSTKNGKDYLYLIWKHPETRKQYIVGILSKNGLFEFEYGKEIDEARKNGFQGIAAFEDFSKKYTSEKLFPVFASRLPDKKRRGISNILKRYNLDEYDEYLLLKNSGARLPIDTFEFIDPIFDDEETISRDFFIAGVRHYLPHCEDKCNFDNVNLNTNDELILELEPDNEFDSNAVEIFNSDNIKLGYIPRYYSSQVAKMMEENKKVTCKVIEFNPNTNCRECIKVNLTIG